MEEKDIFKTETIYDEIVHADFVPAIRYSDPVCNLIRPFLELCLIFYLVHLWHAPVLQRMVLVIAAVMGAFELVKRWVAGKAYQKLTAANGGLPQHTVIRLRADGLQVTNRLSKNQYDFPYDRFRFLISTPKLLILGAPRGRHVILQKTWLQGGTTEELTAFLLEKCPRIRRVRGITFGKWISRILAVTLVICTVASVVLLYGAPLPGTPSKTYRQIAEELAPLGITIREDTIEQYETMMEEYGEIFQDSGYSETNMTLDLLCFEGMGTYDFETDEWTPSSSGVYWFDMEVIFVDSIYTHFLAGLSAMDEELNFSNVTEDYSKVDLESGVGVLPVSFDWNGNHYELEARYNYDWFDEDVLRKVSRIVAADGSGGQIWCAFDGGQGVLVYYGTAEEVRALEQATGIQFTQGVNRLPLF